MSGMLRSMQRSIIRFSFILLCDKLNRCRGDYVSTCDLLSLLIKRFYALLESIVRLSHLRRLAVPERFVEDICLMHLWQELS